MKLSHFEWQLYWPTWFRLWPYYSRKTDTFGPTTHIAAFGPLQFRWWT